MCAVICKGVRSMTASETSWETTEKAVYEISLKGGRILWSGWPYAFIPTPTPYGQLSMIFFGILLSLHFDYMCSETDFTHEKGNFYPTTGIPDSSSYWCCPPDDNLHEAGPSESSFARGRPLRRTICRRLVPLNDHFQESGPSRWSFARGGPLWMTICKRQFKQI